MLVVATNDSAEAHEPMKAAMGKFRGVCNISFNKPRPETERYIFIKGISQVIG